MKVLRNIVIAVAAASVCFSSFELSAAIDNPVTQAVLQVYEKELKKDPKNYMVWFRRANEYYRHNEYEKALADVNNALVFAPAKDTDLRFQAYMLRASIYEREKKYSEELSDLNSALALNPESYAAIYLKANAEYELGNIAAAKTDYTRLQRFNTRSLEAVLGLARCAVKENNLSAANDYLQQATDFAPNDPKVYLRRASVRQMIGDDNGAVSDLIVAMSLDSNNPEAMRGIVDYSNINYSATIAELTKAMQLAPDNAMYRYLRAGLAQAHGNLRAAIDDYRYILENGLYRYFGMNASLAECYYGLGMYDEALLSIGDALGQTNSESNYFVLQSKILRALGRHDDAINAAAKALALDRYLVEALEEMALNYSDKKQYRQADNLLAEASVDDPSCAEPYMLRSWIQKEKLNNPEAAQGFYEKVLELDNYDAKDVMSLRGFALMNVGREPEGDMWMENIIENVPDYDGFNNYYAACYYALRGNTDKALECAEKSMKNGYNNDYNWLRNNDGGINVSGLRDNPRFQQLVQKYLK